MGRTEALEASASRRFADISNESFSNVWVSPASPPARPATVSWILMQCSIQFNFCSCLHLGIACYKCHQNNLRSLQVCCNASKTREFEDSVTCNLVSFSNVSVIAFSDLLHIFFIVRTISAQTVYYSEQEIGLTFLINTRCLMPRVCFIDKLPKSVLSHLLLEMTVLS